MTSVRAARTEQYLRFGTFPEAEQPKTSQRGRDQAEWLGQAKFHHTAVIPKTFCCIVIVDPFVHSVVRRSFNLNYHGPSSFNAHAFGSLSITLTIDLSSKE